MFTDPTFAELYKSWAQTASNAVSACAWFAAAAWFISSNKFRRRIELDVEAKILPLPENPNMKVLEIMIRLENKGFVDHKIRKLNVSVHALNSETALSTDKETGALKFDNVLLEDTDIVPEDLKFFFVRPGVRQIVSHTVPIDGRVSLISIRAKFDYDRKGYYPHTSKHIFPTGIEKSETATAS